ncbi:hypothetical protein AA0474_1752 [Acetobacter lovaniensis NRIC 0474]|nr:hypothetical protein AA0474_1752 [Acetobacter lovaniensis NRIC 0474]
MVRMSMGVDYVLERANAMCKQLGAQVWPGIDQNAASIFHPQKNGCTAPPVAGFCRVARAPLAMPVWPTECRHAR